MEILRYKLGCCMANSYIIKLDNGDAIAVDIGGQEKFLVLEEIKKGFSIKAVLITHGHIDHIAGVKYFKDRGAKIYISLKEKDFLKDENLNLAGLFSEDFIPFDADYYVKNGDIVELFGLKIKVMETAGHTQGGVCYLLDNYLFTGDTIFKGSFGRTDFSTGNFDELINSCNKIFELPSDTIILPGHNEQTTVGEEKISNPIIRYNANN